MNILKNIVKKEFNIKPFEVIELHHHGFGCISGDFFFDEDYSLICIGMAGLVNADNYIPVILKGDLKIEKQNRLVSESTRKMFVLPNESEQLAIDYAKECGMNYFVKQKNGKVWAFVEKPRKTKEGWSPASNLGMMEINIPISFISSEDTEPYFIRNNK